MKNIELECIPSWRYCNIPRGQKGPRYSNWQNTAYTLDQIDATGNVGVLLGPLSAGVCALDFDGTTAWHWFADTFNIELPNTIMWSSGRTDRCQMAFSVPEAYWEYIRTLKIATGDHEGFEFRWTGGQSVLPPSLHPDTQQEYFWVRSPHDTDLSPIPEAVLCHWLELCNPVPPEETVYVPASQNQITEMAAELKRLYPTLDSYDSWCGVTWAFCRELGNADGILLMKYYWPEQEAGEYQGLISSRSKTGKGYTIGTIKWMIKQRGGTTDTTLTGPGAIRAQRQARYNLKETIRNG
jgi:hypothetical protein